MRNKMAWTTPTGILLAVLLALAACSAKEPVLTYKGDIAPIMAQHCVECHSAAKMGAIVSGFDAGSYEKMMNGTKHGLIINPGSAESSPLYLLASGSAAPVIQMKHRDVSLGPEQIETIKLWIDQGAVYLQ